MKYPRLFKKRHPHARALYFQLLMSFSVLAILIVVSTALLFSRIYIRSIQAEMEESARQNLNGHRDEFDRIFMQSGEINRYLRQNPDVGAYLYSKEPDFVSIIRAQMSFNQVHYINPYIHSILFYNRNYKYEQTNLQTGLPGVEVEQFTRKPWNIPRVETDLHLALSTITPTAASGIPHKETLSILFFNQKTLQDEAIIITLDPEEIQKKLLGRLDGYTLVTDQDGHVLFHTFGTEKPKSIAGTTLFQKVIASSSLTGNLRSEWDGTESLITYTHAHTANFLLINIKPYSALMQVVWQRMMTVGLISLFVIFIYLVAGLVLTRRIYTPIQRMTDIIRKAGISGERQQQGEVAYIAGVFDQLVEKQKQLEEGIAGQKVYIRHEYLRNLLLRAAISPVSESEWRSMGLTIRFDNLIILVILIDGYPRMDSPHRFAVENAIRETVPELLRQDFVSESIVTSRGEVAMLLNFRDVKRNDFTKLTSALTRLQESMKASLSITLTIGVGGVANAPEECAAAYNKALQVARHCFTLGPGLLITQAMLDDTVSDSAPYPMELEHAMMTAMRAEMSEPYEEHLDSLLALLAGFPAQTAKSILFQVKSALIRAANEALSPDTSRNSLGFEDFNQMMDTLETLQDAKPFLMSIMTEYLEKRQLLKQQKNSKHYVMVEETQQFIQDHYRDQNLSADSLSERYGYAPYYYSKIFKENAGIGVTDYIRQVRVAQAKTLLSSTSLKAQEIAEHTGFTNIGNFYLVFKKEVGMTPASYRDFCQQR
jgi:two-component system, response regulator YesN